MKCRHLLGMVGRSGCAYLYGCKLYGKCSPTRPVSNIQVCRTCPDHTDAPPADPRIIENIQRQHGPCRGCGD